jgi:ABC-type branched-subunit amino acid transport system ATPase component/branched-subunit amino acid ABC-type transport system permease component
LAATGLVLTYKTSGIFNFGYGALAAIAAYAFYWLHVEQGLPWGVACAISVLGVGPLVGLVMERFAARLAPQRPALKIVGTIGLVLVVQGLATIRYGHTTLPVPQFLPGAKDSFRLFGVVITYDKVIITGVALLAVGALYAFFRWSRTGLAMRALVDDPDLLAMQGTSPMAVRRIAWVIGSTFAALAGVLITPLVGLDAILLTYLVVQAASAAAIGGFASIPLTFAGGVLIGIGANVAQKYSFNTEWLAGLPAALPFLVLFVVLLVRGRRLVPPSRVVVRPPPEYRAPTRVRAVMGAVLVTVLALVPQLVGDKLAFYTAGLVMALMLLSLGLVVRMSGQVSLCHAAFAAIGAVAFSQLIDAGMPWVVALILGGAVAIPVGALVAIPSIRLSGLFLGLATFGFGILVQQLLYPQSFMFGQTVIGREMPQPGFASTPEAFYYVTLAVVAIAAIGVVAVQRSRLGRMLSGLADSPTGVQAMGLSTNVIRVTVFCLSAFIAAEAGILLGVSKGFATGGDPFFDSFNSLILLAMLALAPFAEPWYAFVPAFAAVIPGYVTGDHTTDWLNVLFGVSAIGIAMAGGNPPMPQRLRRLLDRLGRSRGSVTAAPPSPAIPRRAPAHAEGLEIRDLTISFGGLVAVRDLSLRAPSGQITGLIGPNGAGKTSTFNACGGSNRRFSGTVILHGEDVTQMPPAARARRGLGRTFQSVELCDTLSVIENVRLGHEAARAGFNPLTQVIAGPAGWRATQAAARDALQECGLEALADVQAGALSTGERRRVELARCLAGDFDFLLLDEPSSGLDHDETGRFADLLARVVDERGLGVLLVEHDIGLVMRLCTHMYVLDFGELIFDGPPEAVAASDVVQSAYLGTDAVMAAVASPDPEPASR